MLLTKVLCDVSRRGHHWALAEDRAGLLGEEERMQRQHLLVLAALSKIDLVDVEAPDVG